MGSGKITRKVSLAFRKLLSNLACELLITMNKCENGHLASNSQLSFHFRYYSGDQERLFAQAHIVSPSRQAKAVTGSRVSVQSCE